MTLPNFFIVGAPKAGTDELYYHLDQHPQIYMSPLKEPCFFSSEVRVDNFDETLRSRAHAAADSLRVYLESGATSKRFGGIVTSLHDYERLFLHARNELAIGEGSVSYLWSASAASAIASTIPHARIIIVLMDPAERAFHQYLKSLSDGTVTHSFHTHLEMAMQDTGKKLSIYHPFLAFGCYAEQVRRYLRLFSPEQIHLSLYEDREADRANWFRSILNFLGVDDSFVSAQVEIPSTPHLARINLLGRSLNLQKLKPALRGLIPHSIKVKLKDFLYENKEELSLAPEDRAVLVEFYRDDILKLEEILGRDLSEWMRA
jgi:hypothetical protein